MWISIHKACYEKMVEHALTVYPEESCGVLLAQQSKSQIIDCYHITNIHNQKMNAFAFHPEQWVQIFFNAKHQGLEIAGIYHSHPTTEASPSIDDLNGWHDEKLLYAIVSLKQKDSPQIRFFRKNEKHQFESYPLSLA